MNKKQACITLIIALILTSLAFTLLYAKNLFLRVQTNTTGKLVFPNFNNYEIKTIKILRPTGRTITLRKDKNNEWVVANCFDYPANLQKINTFLQELSSMKIVQDVHTEKVGLSVLKLLPPRDRNKNSGSEIVILDEKGTVIFSIIVGIKRIDSIGENEITKGRYLYQKKTNHTFLIEEPLDEINYKIKNWVNTRLLDIKHIKSVKLSKNNKQIWTITRPDVNSNFSVALEKKLEYSNSENIDKIIHSLEKLKFEAIASPTITDCYTGLNNPFTLKIDSFDAQSWQIDIGNQTKDTRYVKIKRLNTTKNSAEISLPENKWTYLVDQNRITPLIQESKKLLKKENKSSKLMLYSSPIS